MSETTEIKKKEKKGLDISAKSFITAIAVIFVLMIATYGLTFVIPGGQYARTVDDAGNTVIDMAGGYTQVEGGIPLWKWALSPFLVLTAEGSGTMLAVIAFLLVIGGVFNSLDKCGLMKYMLDRIVSRFGKRRYLLLAVVSFFFMSLGAFIGSFEECVPLVPIVVALSISLGWDEITGLCMSLMATGCGFASGVCNPFTVGVAQKIAGLPMFSGMWFRLIGYALIYGLLLLFTILHAKRVARPIDPSVLSGEVKKDPRMTGALVAFAAIIGAGIAFVLSSGFVPALQDYTMIIVAVMFLIAGIVCPIIVRMGAKKHIGSFFAGLVSILPAVLMILMAGSIKYTLEEAKILDPILHYAVTAAQTMPRWAVILFIYGLVLLMEFFIASGSAKAILLMPLILPIASVLGISPQLCIVAFAFGDGFSNVFYPTNAALLISLGLVDVSYGKWVRSTWKFQLFNLILTSGLLLLGLAIGYR